MTPAINKDEGRARLADLVARFDQNLAYYRSPDFDELSTRSTFIDPMLEALGWDVTDEAGLGPAREVVLEHRQVSDPPIAGEEEWDRDLGEEELTRRAESLRRYPDYAFRIEGQLRFFIEAKRPEIDIASKTPTFQVKTYAWSSELPISGLSDFEDFRVFDCTLRPDYDDPNAGLILTLNYREYMSRWDELWNLLSREAVLAGSLIRIETAARARIRGAVRVDNAFLDELTKWRREIADELAVRNRGLNEYELAEATQRILDRIVFLRVCEDRLIESSYLLRRYARTRDAYHRLAQEFRRLDVVYNGQLFGEHFSERLELSDWVFQVLIEDLYWPRSPYRFDVLGVDLLGAIYERFLGKTIELEDGSVSLVDKPEVRHAGGVYYTPRWIVDYIVRATIAPALEGKTPRAAANLRILDPACGSGSFLLGALDYLIEWHEQYYTNHPSESPERHYEGSDGRRRLTSDAKGEILTKCIYGVDIDPQAVEVTQMSLYLKILEGEDAAILRDRRLFHGALLPPLNQNIRCGNSLLSPSDVAPQLLLGYEQQRRINPFDWSSERDGFGAVFAQRGGFDAIIGNPPYTRVQVLRRYRPEETEIYARLYRSAAEGSFDIAGLFVERCMPFLRQSPDSPGRLGMIISRQFAEAEYGQGVRSLLSSGQHVEAIIDFQSGLVFEGVGAYTLILVANQRRQGEFRLTRVPVPPSPESLVKAQLEGTPLNASMLATTLTGEPWDLTLPNERGFLDRLASDFPNLGDVANGRIFQGVVTGADNTVFRLKDCGPDRTEPTRRLVVPREFPDRDPFPIEEALLRPVFEGRSGIGRFFVKDSDEFVLLPYSRPNSEDRRELIPSNRYELIPAATLQQAYPMAWDWLTRNEQLLRSRSGQWTDSNWFSFSRRQNLELFEENKILVPYMVDELGAHWDEGGHFFVNVASGGYGVIPTTEYDPEYITALLNSRLLSWVLRAYSRAWRGGWFAARKGNLVRLPIAFPGMQEQHQIVEAFESCRSLKRQLDQASTDHERDVAERLLRNSADAFDAAIERAYGVTEDEFHIVTATYGAEVEEAELLPAS